VTPATDEQRRDAQRIGHPATGAMSHSSAPAPSATLRLGQALFRFRSFTPVPVLAVLAWLLWRARSGPGPLWLDALGLSVSLLGQAVRFYTVSQVSDGTSGQDDVLEAKVLNTKGPYARVRNPLYVGNLLICLGLMILAKDPYAAALGLAFFFGEYFFIIRAEEDFLRAQFGAAYDAYVREVPRWVPRLTPASGGALGRLDWRRGLKKEHNPFAAWSLGALALLAWQAQSPMPYATLGAAVLVLFAAIKAWKRRWFH
jgi:protein-S-isoprenylcysteine O-methyltransferase Ste14